MIIINISKIVHNNFLTNPFEYIRKVLGIQRYWERNLNGHCLLFRQKTFFIHSKLGQMSISFKMLSKNTLMGFSMIVN